MPEPFETRLQHECFPQPRSGSIAVWRYMGFAHLVSLLMNAELHFSRLDLLHDPHEGSLPRAIVSARDALFEKEGIAKHLPYIRDSARRIRTACYVNCWSMNDFESEALWRLFSGDRGGIAIQSTYEELVELIKHDDGLYVGCVKYIDYDKEWFPSGNVFYPVMHKRQAFAHEHEIRIVKIMFPHLADHEPPGPVGIKVPVNLDSLIKGIFVNPYADEWYTDTVRSVVEKFAPALVGRVSWSRMKAAPLY